MRVREGLRGALALITAAAALTLLPAAPAVAGEDLEAELFDVQIVCGARCPGLSLQVRLRNSGRERICVISSDIRFLPGRLNLFEADGRLPLPSYNGGSGPPPPKYVDATEFAFPVYVISPGKEIIVRSSGNGFFDIARGEAARAMLSFRTFACGDKASKRADIQWRTASAPVRYEDAYDAPGVVIPELRGR